MTTIHRGVGRLHAIRTRLGEPKRLAVAEAGQGGQTPRASEGQLVVVNQRKALARNRDTASLRLERPEVYRLSV